MDHTGGKVCLEETVDGKAKEVAVEEDRVKESAGWISGCIGIVLSLGWGVVDSDVGWGVVDSDVGWGVVDSDVGWGVVDSDVGWGVVDSDVGWGVVDSDVGWGWSVVDSNVGWGVEVGVIDSVVGKRWLVRVMFDELAGRSVVEIGEAQERGTAGVSEDK